MSSHLYRPYFAAFAKIHLAFSLLLGGCGLAKKGDTCPLNVDGLREDGWSGSSLSDLQLSLIFLEGPTTHTEAIASYLAEEGVSAGFFVKGSEVEEHREVLQDLKNDGHLIGTGGFRFQSLKNAEDPVLELRTADAQIQEFTVGSQFWLYGPADSVDAKAHEQLLHAGLGKYIGPIYEDTDGEDFVPDNQCWLQDLTVSACAQLYLTELQRIRRGIFALHDTDPRSEELLRELLPQLQAFGFSFVRLDEIPDLRVILGEVGGLPDASSEDSSCHDYE